MASFKTHHDMERGEFQDLIEEYPELVLIVGRCGSAYGSHSLASVLDVYSAVLITNDGNGWSVLVERKGRETFIRGKERGRRRKARRR